MAERTSSKNSQAYDYYSPESPEKLSPRSNQEGKNSRQQKTYSRDSYYDAKRPPTEQYERKLTPFREESYDSLDTEITNVTKPSTIEPTPKSNRLNDDQYTTSRRSNVASSRNTRINMDDSDNLDDTLISKASFSNPPPPSSYKYRETITPPPPPISRDKVSPKNASRRYQYYDREDDYSFAKSPRKPTVLRQRYPSYDSFTNQNSRYSLYSRPRSTYRRRHLNVAGDNIISKSLTRNYIYHRQPFDWYNSTSGVLLDDVEEIIPVPGGLDEPHLNAPYERTSSDERELNEDFDLKKPYPKDNSYDSQQDYYENRQKQRRKPLPKNYSEDSLVNSKRSIREPSEKDDKENIDNQENRKKSNKNKNSNNNRNNDTNNKSSNGLVDEYEYEKKNKSSKLFSDDEKKANELVLKTDKTTNTNSDSTIEDNKLDSDNKASKIELQPQQLVINAQSVTINTDSIKTNLPSNILTENDIGKILNTFNQNLNNGPAYFQPNRNNFIPNNNYVQPYHPQMATFQPNFLSNYQNQNIQPENIQLPTTYNYSTDDSLQPQPTSPNKISIPQKSISFQPNYKITIKKSDELVKSILKDIVTVASEDAEKIILNNPFDQRTDVYKMLKDKSKSNLDDHKDNNNGIQVFQNTKFVNNNNQGSSSANKKPPAFPSQENIKALSKLTLGETEKLKKLCDDLKSLNAIKQKK